ncbi:hypothetical protein GCM10027277_52050 [Pseudoduganella ginsengisoli]|uniref:DUF1080 domain-containing protein n=1 Tax=Pseudoduganella ginsengisoli TaxID=1462440 RepID=A0A6L6Q3J6_9BURK|nr:DUF1080 domain-containing protein [Pseudoduganella ginsengisoli]MTW04423.1 DUF1080 domain-containing protein [Pseudoduganella ginsengisoli]
MLLRSAFAAAWFACAASVAAAPAQPAPGFADAVLGRWNLTITGKDGVTYPSWFDIRLRKETELMATMVGRFGSSRYASEVDYSGGKLVLRVPRQYEKDTADLIFDGMAAGDRMSGTTVDEDGVALSWIAHRAPLLPRKAGQRWSRPVELFNGRNLDGWRPQQPATQPCWKVEKGILTNSASCTNLISDVPLGDFKLRMEFMSVAGGNSGVYLRGRYEVQLGDAYGMPPDALRMGGIYGHLRPQVNASRKPGEWQVLEVALSGRFVTVVLNGVTVIDSQEIPGITGGALDSREGDKGPLMLQGDHTPIMIRKISVARAAE